MKEYGDLLKQVNAFLKPYKFSKKGTSFIREKEGFYDVINFQKNTSSTKYRALFCVNIGVTSKKILEHKKLKFSNNLMNSQWQTRLDSLTGKHEFAWVSVDNSIDVGELCKKLADEFVKHVFPALQVHNDEFYIVEKLKTEIVKTKDLVFLTAEYLLILVARSFPEKIDETLRLFASKIKDSNDRLFIQELMGELNIPGRTIT